MKSSQVKYVAHRRVRDEKIQSVEEHLLGVAKISQRFAEKIGLGSAGELVGLLHDFGKYSSKFQCYIQSATKMIDPDEDEFVDVGALKGKIDHSTAGAQYIWNHYAKKGPIGRIAGQIFALCVASHHSGLIDCLKPDGENNFARRMKKEDEKTSLSEVTQNADIAVLEYAKELLNHPSLLNDIKNKIIELIKEHPDDSQENNIVAQFKIGLLIRFIFSCLIDADRIDTADFENPQAAKKRYYGMYGGWNHLVDRFESYIKKIVTKEKIDFVRKEISDHCLSRAQMNKGLFTLTVPTGGGKTLASLRYGLHHAQHHKLDRIIYVIPFTSIIDQNARVVRDILETEEDEGSIVLEHHSNLTPELQTWKSKILSENWDAPIVFTTMVQLLETLFGAGTRDARRMHQLANSLIIFDEIQSLPIRCIHLFCNAINYLVDHCGSSVVLCTATQPLLAHLREKKKGFLPLSNERELIGDVSKLFCNLKRVEVHNHIRPGGWSDEEISKLAIDEMEHSSSCLVIVNTKVSAQSIFQKCKESTIRSVYHLSTNMCAAHRLKILDEIRSKLGNEPLICVSTQLIEAGVDIDFGSVVRYLAGMDSIAQAAGRCNRHGRQVLGRVHIVNSQAEKLDKLEDIRIGKEISERILYEYQQDSESLGNDLLHPKVMNRYFTYYYHEKEQSDKMVYPVGVKDIDRGSSLLDLLSVNNGTPENNSLKFPYTLRHSFSSAADVFKSIDAPTQSVIVPYGEEGSDLMNQLLSSGALNLAVLSSVLKKAQRYSVNVFPRLMQALQNKQVLKEIEDTGIFYLIDARYYSEEFGLSSEPVTIVQPYYF